MIDTAPTFEFPTVRSKKITAAFDGERMSSDAGVMLLAEVKRRLGIAEHLAALVPDGRFIETLNCPKNWREQRAQVIAR